VKVSVCHGERRLSLAGEQAAISWVEVDTPSSFGQDDGDREHIGEDEQMRHS
jgi:hypothetical protein